MMQIQVDKKDVDLRYVFGIIILWVGAGLLVLMFVDFLMHDEISPIGPVIPLMLVPTPAAEVLALYLSLALIIPCLKYMVTFRHP